MGFNEGIKLFANKKSIIVGGIVSFLLAYSLVIGYLCHNYKYELNAGVVAAFICIWIIAYILVVLGWILIDKSTFAISKKNNVSNDSNCNNSISIKKQAALYGTFFILICLAWTPCFIISYPGFFVYDAGWQFLQIWYAEIPVMAEFPILHSLILWLSLKVGTGLFDSYNTGIAIFTCVHILLGASVFAYVTLFLRKNCSRIISIIALLYYMFSPTIVLYAPNSNSTIFGSLLASFIMIQFYELFFLDSVKNKKKSYVILRIVLFAITSILMCNTRKSFLALYSIMTILYLIMNWSRKIIKNVVFLTSLLIVMMAFNSLINHAFDAEPANPKDKIGVPIQQLSFVYLDNPDYFTEEEKKDIEELYDMDTFIYYCPETVDPVKMAVKKEVYASKPMIFWKLWLKKGLQHPLKYLEAWNYLTYEAWYPFCEIDGYIKCDKIIKGEETSDKSNYMYTQISDPGVLVNRFPKLFDNISWFASGVEIHKIPIVGQLATLGFQYYYMIFALGYCLYSNKRFKILVGAEFLYFVVALFAPMVLIRYHLLVFYMFPIVLASLFVGKTMTKKEEVLL